MFLEYTSPSINRVKNGYYCLNLVQFNHKSRMVILFPLWLHIRKFQNNTSLRNVQDYVASTDCSSMEFQPAENGLTIKIILIFDLKLIKVLIIIFAYFITNSIVFWFVKRQNKYTKYESRQSNTFYTLYLHCNILSRSKFFWFVNDSNLFQGIFPVPQFLF